MFLNLAITGTFAWILVSSGADQTMTLVWAILLLSILTKRSRK